MNLYYSGIGIARCLHDSGIEVYGLSAHGDAPGNRSRLFRRVHKVPDSSGDPEVLCESLIRIRKNYQDAPVIFPTRDFDVLFLEQNRQRLGSFYRLPQTDGCAVSRLLDKLEVARVAEHLGIDTPRTLSCRSAQEVMCAQKSMNFPVILKPRSSHQWRGIASWKRVGAKKVILVGSTEELASEYRKVSMVTEEVILQEYIPGEDGDCVSFGCYMNRKGDLEGYFTTRKVIQSPALLGTGCVVETADIPEIVSPSVELLQSFGYAGIAEVEFKYNKEKSVYSLIEINPRHWDQHELGRLVGVNLTMIALSDMISERSATQRHSYRGHEKEKWIAEREVFLYLVKEAYLAIRTLGYSRRRPESSGIASSIRSLRKRLGEAAVIFRGRRVFGLFSLVDPVPFMVMSLQIAAELFRALATHVRKGLFFRGR